MSVAFGTRPVSHHGVGSVLAPRFSHVIVHEAAMSQKRVDANAAFRRVRREPTRARIRQVLSKENMKWEKAAAGTVGDVIVIVIRTCQNALS